MTSAFSEGVLIDTSDLHRLVYKPRISSNTSFVFVMRESRTKVSEVLVVASSFKNSPADTESASLIRGVGGQYGTFS
jgi:hypothetical protein